MLRTKLICFLIVGLVLLSTFAIAGQPQNYAIAYTFKNPDGSTFRLVKYYLQNNNKFRTEHISTVQYNISAETEVTTDLSDSGSTDASVNHNAELKPESTPDSEPHTIEILRKDKRLVWTLTPSFKVYSEVPLAQDSWESTLSQISPENWPDSLKAGEASFLNYPCDIYKSTQIWEGDKWTNIFYVAQGINIVLRSEILKNDKLMQTMEATEFSMEKPESSLFEVPDKYKKD